LLGAPRARTLEDVKVVTRGDVVMIARDGAIASTLGDSGTDAVAPTDNWADAATRRTDLLDLIPGSPYRPLDFRWELAYQLRVKRIRVRRAWRDLWIDRARDYLRHARRLGDLRHLRLAARDPALAAAVTIWRLGCPRLRDEVEIRLLSGQDSQTIAQRCRLDPAAIELGERLFFCVVDRFAHRDSLVMSAIGPALYEPIPDLRTVTRWLALALGPRVIDDVLAVTGLGHAPIDAPVGPRSAEVRLRLRLLILAKTTPADGRALQQLARLDALSAEFARLGCAESTLPSMRLPTLPAVGDFWPAAKIPTPTAPTRSSEPAGASDAPISLLAAAADDENKRVRRLIDGLAGDARSALGDYRTSLREAG
jgi:hypothetical protein